MLKERIGHNGKRVREESTGQPEASWEVRSSWVQRVMKKVDSKYQFSKTLPEAGSTWKVSKSPSVPPLNLEVIS